ncbi:FdtA/QdtA family cupin domain-containing protein [Bacteroides fragilis]|nr:FdtA/QdtA family cupin domain-containing protein [Bacteroides fragilis]MCE8640970.1 FdtA/QdtA family cupin domain-containing protein [Bacteroides fragilis]
MTINDCRLIEFPRFLDARGNLSFAENFKQVPFEIKRIYWLYDVPGGIARGGHAEINNEELIIALSGAFEILVDDGKKQRAFSLNRSYYGLYIPKGLWREIKEFSTNAVALEFGSIPYDVNDYVRNYNDFLEFCKIAQDNAQEGEQIASAPTAEGLIVLRNVFDCTILELDKHHSDRRGNLTVVENGKTLPFDVRRTYYLYDVPGGESRGAHAHRELEQLIVAVSGSFTVTLDDGHCKRSFFLNRPYQGLYVKPGMWRTLEDFSSGAVCMVLASDVYKVSDYIRTYDEFIQFRKDYE